MKVFVVLTVLLVAANAVFLSQVGDFMKRLLNNFAHTAGETLENAGTQLLKNVTGQTANMLSETGQMALLELGNELGTKRGVADVVSQLLKVEQGFKTALENELHTLTDGVKGAINLGVQTAKNFMEGAVDQLHVEQLIPQLESAVHSLQQTFNGNLASSLMSLLRAGHVTKRDVFDLQAQLKDLETFLQPLHNVVNQEMSVLTQALHDLTQHPLEVVQDILTRLQNHE